MKNNLNNKEKNIEKQHITEKYFLDNMFKNIDENIKLDDEQKKIIKTDAKNLMVIAGAGSGKTTTISAKIHYLIERKKIKDDEILVISFTNKAVEELKERINNDFKHNVKITTFHKFGYDIIKNNIQNPPRILNSNYEIIKEYIEKEIINNKKELKKFLNLFINYFNIDETIQIYKNYHRYRKKQNKEKYPTLKHKIEYINGEINRQIEKNKTIKEEYTKNKNETAIANFLYINNISYKYNEEYPYKKRYKPTFTIYNKNERIYIEYFDKEKKEKTINKIRKIHKNKKTKLIEITQHNTIVELKNQLLRENIELKEKTLIELFNQITKINQNTNYEKFINFCRTYISLKKTKENNKKNNSKEQRTKMFKQFADKLYEYYQKELQKQNRIDFDDIINIANKIIKSNQKINMKYKYIIVDEYQDISKNRYELIQNITKKIKNKTMVVGDDWQCIYSFASSDISLFSNYKENIEKCRIMKITKTYRNSQQLIDIAGSFIQKNKKQIRKTLKSSKKLNNPITILRYKNNKIKEKTIEAIEYLIKKYGEEKEIMILGRYTFDKKNIIDNKNIIENKQRIIYKNKQQVKIEYITVHASKGLGASNVIIINAKNDKLGFPSKIKNDPILEEYIKESDEIKYAEERRLFYVALTRTKNEVIIITPQKKESVFIKEIKKNKNVRTTKKLRIKNKRGVNIELNN
jgi:DNA helicase-4